MTYKRLITFNIIALFITSMVLLYNFFSPKLESTQSIYVQESTLSIENLENYVLSQSNSSKIYVLIGDTEDNNTIYLLETVLKNCANSAQVEYFNNLEFVQATNTLANKKLLTDLYYVNTTPAFVSIENIDGTMNITSTLTWDQQEPITENDVVEWMKLNNIWPKQ